MDPGFIAGSRLMVSVLVDGHQVDCSFVKMHSDVKQASRDSVIVTYVFGTAKFAGDHDQYPSRAVFSSRRVYVGPALITPAGVESPPGLCQYKGISRMGFCPFLELLECALRHTSRVPMEGCETGMPGSSMQKLWLRLGLYLKFCCDTLHQ